MNLFLSAFCLFGFVSFNRTQAKSGKLITIHSRITISARYCTKHLAWNYQVALCVCDTSERWASVLFNKKAIESTTRRRNEKGREFVISNPKHVPDIRTFESTQGEGKSTKRTFTPTLARSLGRWMSEHLVSVAENKFRSRNRKKNIVTIVNSLFTLGAHLEGEIKVSPFTMRAKKRTKASEKKTKNSSGT